MKTLLVACWLVVGIFMMSACAPQTNNSTAVPINPSTLSRAAESFPPKSTPSPTSTPETLPAWLPPLSVPRIYISSEMGVVAQYGDAQGDLALSSSGDAFAWIRQETYCQRPTRWGAVFVPGYDLLGPRPIDANQPVSIAVESSQERIVTGSLDGAVEIWNARTGVRDQLLGQVHGRPTGIVLNADETQIAVGAKEQNRGGVGSVKIWDRAEPNTPTILPTSGEVTRLQFAPNANTLYFSTNANSCELGGGGVFAVAGSGKEPTEVFSAAGNSVIDFAVHPAGNVIASVGQTETERCDGQTVVSVWDMESGQVLHVFKPEHAEENQDPTLFDAASVAFSSDGKRLAVGDNRGFLSLWDWEQEQKLDAFHVSSDPVVRVIWSADNTLFVSEIGRVHVFSAP